MSKFAYRFDTSLGAMAIAWQGEKVIATRLPDQSDDALLESLRLHCGEISWREDAPAFVLGLASKIREHLAGNPQQFPLHVLDLRSTSPFFRKVYELAHAIPSGEQRTYGELARAAGSPGASRAVGQAMARNPFPLVIPCHRVLGGKQALVGFSAPGGLDTKMRLLELENGLAKPALSFAASPVESLTDNAAIGFADHGTHH
jgi:methylated-DNA-[protein]-cysteine S-methyltransferase